MKKSRKIAALFFVLCLPFALAEVKDPHLIAGVEFQTKPERHSILKRNEYSKYNKLLTKEEMDIYIIADRLIRANNLQYKNWRIGFKLDKDVINAVSLNNNLILINSSLYDCIHQNKDALAFVVAHELAHFVLSHQKYTIENTYKIKKIEENIKKIEELKTSSKDVFVRNLKNLANNIYYSQRNLEFSADAEALNMLTVAGYDINNSLEVFEYIDEDYEFLENKNTYPMIYERIDNLKREQEFLDKDALVLIGKNNLNSTTPLVIQKSMDKETLVINKPSDYKNYSYKLISKNEKVLNKAYSFYKKENFNEAIEYFTLAYNNNPNNYIAPLYLSYSYEAIGNEKLAKRYIKKARSLKPRDSIIIAQYKALYKK